MYRVHVHLLALLFVVALCSPAWSQGTGNPQLPVPIDVWVQSSATTILAMFQSYMPFLLALVTAFVGVRVAVKLISQVTK